jgi:monovalent cation:H+ antiporter-2, CPA2 family
MEIPLLPDIVTIFGLSIVVLLFCHRIHLPPIVGFIFTGILCGPHGLALVKAESEVQVLAQLGIILLLFSVGMEFSFKKILEYKRYFVIGGTLQVGLTILAGFVIGVVLGRPLGESLFLGFIISLSSTAIVIRLLEDKRETDSPHGHLIMGIMIFQDIAAIPMMLTIPMLAGSAQEMDQSSLILFIKGLVILGVVLFSAAKLVPPLLYHIAKTGSRELFLLSVLTICFAVAWLTASVGLSLSLGAFLAGLTISDTEYRTEAVSDILPFQDIFTSLFFVSIGMLLDVAFVLNQPLLILLVAVGVLSLKFFLAGFTAAVLGMPLRTVVIAGIALCQVGEFSFVLAKSGVSMGISDEFHYQLFLAVSLLTMAVTPTLINLSPAIANLFLRLPLPNLLKSGHKTYAQKERHSRQNHIIIIGFGLSGQNLVRSAKAANLPYVIIDMNAETVKKERLRGEPIYYGDAAHEHILHHANISEAKVIAVVINDALAAERIVEKARKLNKEIYIVVRTRYLKEMRGMIQLGADEVIPDEFGSSVEIFIRVLNKYHIPTDEVQKIVSAVRVEGYEMCRLLYKEPSTLADLKIALSDVLIETFRVGEESLAQGRSLGEMELRKQYGVNAMLVHRGEETIKQLDAQTRLLFNDLVVVCGTHDNLAKLSALFKPNHALKETLV